MSAVPSAIPPLPKPKPDKAALLAALAALFEPDDVIELRAIFARGRTRIDAGYFDGAHREALADAAAKLNAEGAAVYVTLNRIDPQLLARYCNRAERYAKTTTGDANVIRRRWLLIDLDPVRLADTAATDAQVQAAKERAQDCYRLLKSEGWPEPLAGASGNGWHLLYPLDLPNDPESATLVKGALAGLAARLDDETVCVDQTVFNAARITKLYGTVATKGDHTALAPWRRSSLLSTPERGDPVTLDQLRTLHPTPAAATPKINGDARRGAFDLIDFLRRLGIEYEQDRHEGRERFKLARCPFNEAHGRGEAAILQDASGKLGFKCQHDSCADKHWQDVRTLLDGPREARSGALVDLSSMLGGINRAARKIALESDSETWPEPQSLTAKIEPEPYPLDALPDGIRAAVQEVVGFVKAPLPLVASSALGALSLACQAQADAQRGEGLHGPCGLYLLAIADSGERKTTCDKQFATAIHEYEAEQAEIAKPALKQYAADLRAWKAECEGIEARIKADSKVGKPVESWRAKLVELQKDEPEPPRVPRLIYGDATPEALTWELAKRWPSAGVISSEAGAILGSHGMGSDSLMRYLSTLNELWDGTPKSFTRRTSESYTVRARLTVALQVQEATLRDFFGRSRGLARGTGFLARFLVAWPVSTQGTRFYSEAPSARPALSAFNRRIAVILRQPVPMDDDGALTPPVLPFAPEAKAAWIAFHDAIERELCNGGELRDVRDVASKAADNAARMAALFHAFAGGAGAIGADAFAGAARIVAWHLNESRRFFGELALPAELSDAARLDAWLIEHCRRERVGHADRREAQRGGPVRDGERLTAALRVLAELDRAREGKDGKRKLILLNPALLAGQA